MNGLDPYDTDADRINRILGRLSSLGSTAEVSAALLDW
jgi:hypothetical protein